MQKRKGSSLQSPPDNGGNVEFSNDLGLIKERGLWMGLRESMRAQELELRNIPGFNSSGLSPTCSRSASGCITSGRGRNVLAAPATHPPKRWSHEHCVASSAAESG